MIYWDHNATSPLRRRVKERMIEALELYQGNPNSSHALGQTARAAIEKARRTMAQALGAEAGDLVFAASATEANLMALWGLWFEQQKKYPERKAILLSPLEHSSVFENAYFLRDKFGAEIELMPLDSKGAIDLEKTNAILKTKRPLFCSMAAAHNESGILQSWNEVCEMAYEHQVPFHTDLVQCVGRMPIELRKSGADLATISFHKVGGPKGVALLYLKPGTQIESIIRGGSQEKKRRAGTENIVAILGAEAVAEDLPLLEKEFLSKIKNLRDEFERKLKAAIPSISIVGEKTERLPNTAYIVFSGIKSDRLLMSLDFKGLCVSSGAACSSGMILPSKALLALGYSEPDAMSAIRFSLGPDNSIEEVDKVLEAVQTSANKLAV